MCICLTVAGSLLTVICHVAALRVAPAVIRLPPGRSRKVLLYAKVTKKVENFNYIDYFCKQNYRLWFFADKL